MLNKTTIEINGKKCTIMQFPFAEAIRITCKLVPFINLFKVFLATPAVPKASPQAPAEAPKAASKIKSIVDIFNSDISADELDKIFTELCKLVADDESIVVLMKKILGYAIVDDKFLNEEQVIDSVFQGDFFGIFKLAFEIIKFNAASANFFSQAKNTTQVLASEKAAKPKNI